MHVLKFVEPITRFIPNFKDIEKSVKNKVFDEVLQGIGTRRSVVLTGRELCKVKEELSLPSKVSVIECFKISINYLPISVTVYFEDCPWKFVTMLKLGGEIKEILNLGDSLYLAKLLTENSVRRMYLGKLIHDEYLRTLEAYLSEYKFVSEVEVEKNFSVKVCGVKQRLFTLIGRCDGILVDDDDMYVLELKLVYKDYHMLQHTLYALCLDVDKLLIVDKFRKSIVEPMSRKEVAKKMYMIYKVLNNKEIDVEPNRKKCRKCIYREVCVFLKKKMKKLIEY